MKKKVNLFGKSIPVFVIVFLGLGLVSAALVPYLSGLGILGTVTVESPMKIVMTGISVGVYDNDLGTFTVDTLHGGESFSLDTTTTNEGADIIDDLLIEVKVADFDGEGITYFYAGNTWSGDLPVCTSGIDAYYYFGPFTAASGYNEVATSTITTSHYLEPKTYTATTGVILAGDRKCIA